MNISSSSGARRRHTMAAPRAHETCSVEKTPPVQYFRPASDVLTCRTLLNNVHTLKPAEMHQLHRLLESFATVSERLPLSQMSHQNRQPLCEHMPQLTSWIFRLRRRLDLTMGTVKTPAEHALLKATAGVIHSLVLTWYLERRSLSHYCKKLPPPALTVELKECLMRLNDVTTDIFPAAAGADLEEARQSLFTAITMLTAAATPKAPFRIEKALDATEPTHLYAMLVNATPHDPTHADTREFHALRTLIFGAEAENPGLVERLSNLALVRTEDDPFETSAATWTEVLHATAATGLKRVAALIRNRSPLISRIRATDVATLVGMAPLRTFDRRFHFDVFTCFNPPQAATGEYSAAQSALLMGLTEHPELWNARLDNGSTVFRELAFYMLTTLLHHHQQETLFAQVEPKHLFDDPEAEDNVLDALEELPLAAKRDLAARWIDQASAAGHLARRNYRPIKERLIRLLKVDSTFEIPHGPLPYDTTYRSRKKA